MKALYWLSVIVYGIAIRIAALGSEKARLWVEGRRNWRQRMPASKKNIRFWFHCASLGEFEQARPLIEYYSGQGIEIVLSFFSPSGYLQRKNYPLASWVGYLPLDGRKAARDFVEAMDADKVFFVKYEFWYFFVAAISKKKLPFYLISARFRADQPFFKWYGTLHREMLRAYTQVFTQDETSADLIRKIGVGTVSAVGDTRFDRVMQLAERRENLPFLEQFSSGHITLVAGSCWPAEENLIYSVLHEFPEMHWVLVPHDVSENRINELRRKFEGQCIVWSELELGKGLDKQRVLIIDKIGLLGSAYSYASMAFVGGGFSNALHNILEAAVWKIPVIYGNNTVKYPEGKQLTLAGGGFAVYDKETFSNTLKQLSNEDFRQKAGESAGTWVKENTGAVKAITRFVGV